MTDVEVVLHNEWTGSVFKTSTASRFTEVHLHGEGSGSEGFGGVEFQTYVNKCHT